MDSTDDRLMTTREVAKFLAISLRSLQRHRDEGNIPQPVRFGRTLRWSRNTLNRWIAAQDKPRPQEAG